MKLSNSLTESFKLKRGCSRLPTYPNFVTKCCLRWKRNRMQNLFNQWWYGGVVVPTVITVFVGGLISVGAGFVCARLVAFDQARMSGVQATRDILNVADKVPGSDVVFLVQDIAGRMTGIATEFLRLRQERAMQIALYLAWRIAETVPAQVKALQLRPGQPLSLDQRQQLLNRLNLESRVYGAMLFDLRPNFVMLFHVRSSVRAKDRIGKFDPRIGQAAEQPARCDAEATQR
jgi:hypothetical protein